MPNVKLIKVLNKLGEALSTEIDINHLVEMIVQHGVELVDASFGAFFYHAQDEEGNKLDLVAVHGASVEQFTDFGRLSATPLLTSHVDAGLTLIDDVQRDARYGQNRHGGIPKGHLPVRSYLAVPVASRSGARIGSLLFGHSEPCMFTEAHGQAIIGLASMGGVAMDNASLYLAAQREIAERVEAEAALRAALDRQELLLDELNHRVKNTLMTIQSIAVQTRNSLKSASPSIDEFYHAFESRLLSVSRAHDLLVVGAWSGVALEDTIRAAITPNVVDVTRFALTGRVGVILNANAAVTLNMVFHELSTNALKYGALVGEGGTISVDWCWCDDEVSITWKERGGPSVTEPVSSGFGTRLIKRGAMRELDGAADLIYETDGLKCVMKIPVSAKVSVK